MGTNRIEVRYLYVPIITTSIDKMQSNKTINICIAKRCFYMASLNDMFRPLYRPSSGCTFSYFKANCKINNVFFLFLSTRGNYTIALQIFVSTNNALHELSLTQRERERNHKIKYLFQPTMPYTSCR